MAGSKRSKEKWKGVSSVMAREIYPKIIELVRRAAQLARSITRNTKVFFAVFYEANQTKCKVIYEIEVNVVVAETERQLDRSRNAISHVGFSEDWARANGRVVYKDKS